MENAVSPGRGAPSLQAAPAKPVDVSAIERELAALWGPPAPDGQETVTRACMSNLIVFCASQTEAAQVSQEMGVIAQLHPSRVLLLVGDNPGAVDLEAYVAAQCYLAGGGRQVCSEHITVRAPSGATRRLPSVARPLLIGDLPTALWWVSADAPPQHGDLFTDLASMTDHVIYDSLGWTDPVRAVVATANWALHADTDQIPSDLTWRRLKPWRRLIGQSLDPSIVPGALDAIREVVVEHGPHALPQAWLLIGWLACRLGWRPLGGTVAPGAQVTWTFHAPTGPVAVTIRRLSEGDSALRTVSIGWSTGGRSDTMRFSALGNGRLGVASERAGGSLRVVAAPVPPRANLVARQLPDLGRDPLFLDTLAVAATMAKALL
jgi:glucose-6-phosphate dehydrogenase assembly protein OpcA